MKNKWTLIFKGYVSMELSGGGIERFLNECNRTGMMLWNIERKENGNVRCNVLLKDVSKLQRIKRNHDCSIRFKKRSGLPFMLKKSLINSGIVAGILLFIGFILLFSNMVLGIEIKGAKPETEVQIRKELNELGVKKGKLQFLIMSIEEIQRNLTNNIPSITWVGVELKGTTFHLKIVEKNDPKREEELAPRNLIASKEAVITKMYVKTGKPMVQVNDHVEKGQLLVSGVIGSEESPYLLPAQGTIYGETWYTTTVSVPLKSTFQVLTSDFHTKHFMNVNGIKIKFFGFDKDKYKEKKVETYMYQVHFLKWALPIYYIREKEKKVIIKERSYTTLEAREVSREISAKNLKKMLDKHAKIISGTVLEEKLSDNRELMVTYHYKVIENVAVVQPLGNIPIKKDDSQ